MFNVHTLLLYMIRMCVMILFYIQYICYSGAHAIFSFIAVLCTALSVIVIYTIPMSLYVPYIEHYSYYLAYSGVHAHSKSM